MSRRRKSCRRLSAPANAQHRECHQTVGTAMPERASSRPSAQNRLHQNEWDRARVLDAITGRRAGSPPSASPGTLFSRRLLCNRQQRRLGGCRGGCRGAPSGRSVRFRRVRRRVLRVIIAQRAEDAVDLMLKQLSVGSLGRERFSGVHFRSGLSLLSAHRVGTTVGRNTGNRWLSSRRRASLESIAVISRR